MTCASDKRSYGSRAMHAPAMFYLICLTAGVRQRGICLHMQYVCETHMHLTEAEVLTK